VRTGVDWQLNQSPASFISTVVALTVNPNHFFRTMNAGGPNWSHLLFLSFVLCLVSLLWVGLSVLATQHGYWHSMLRLSGLVLLLILLISLLCMIEVTGVVIFSRRRGWRVPMRLAERIVCYSSIGWVPATGVMWLALHLVKRGYVDRWMAGLLPAWEPWQSWALLLLIAGLAMLWFEVLVYLGVRQVKHANSGA
jgi:hypothetical protein